MTSPEEDFAKALEVLNSAYKADPAAIHALICIPIPCSGIALRDHPWVVVGDSNVVPESYTVSTLGLINGILHALTGKRIAMAWTDTPDENGRRKFLGFVEYKEATYVPPVVNPSLKTLQEYSPPIIPEKDKQ